MKKLMLPPTLQVGANTPTNQVSASTPTHQDGAPKRQPGYEFLKRFLMHLAFLYSENVYLTSLLLPGASLIQNFPQGPRCDNRITGQHFIP